MDKPIIYDAQIIDDDEDNISSSFKNWQKNKTKFKAPQNEPKPKVDDDDDDDDEEDNISIEDAIKINVFGGLLFMLLDEFNAFIYSQATKYNFSAEDLAYTQPQKNGLISHLKSKKIAGIISKIPGWAFFIFESQWYAFQNYRKAVRILEKEESLKGAKNNKSSQPAEEKKSEAAPKKRKYKKRKKISKLRHIRTAANG